MRKILLILGLSVALFGAEDKGIYCDLPKELKKVDKNINRKALQGMYSVGEPYLQDPYESFYNRELYMKYTTCEERLEAYNQALKEFQENAFGINPNNRTLDSYIDRQIKRKDNEKMYDASYKVFERFRILLEEKITAKGVKFRY